MQHILTMQHKRSALKALNLILIFWGGVCHEHYLQNTKLLGCSISKERYQRN